MVWRWSRVCALRRAMDGEARFVCSGHGWHAVNISLRGSVACDRDGWTVEFSKPGFAELRSRATGPPQAKKLVAKRHRSVDLRVQRGIER